MKIYPLSIDYLFKKVFKNNLKALNLMVNEFLDIDSKVEDITIIDRISEPKYYEGKTIINDIKFSVKDKNIVLLEMQNNFTKEFLNRMAYYITRIFDDSCKEGYTYFSCSDVYGIFIIRTNDKMFPNLFTKFSCYDTLGIERSPLNWAIINLNRLDKNTKSFSNDMMSVLKLVAAENENEIEMMKRESLISEELYNELKETCSDEEMKEILWQLEKQRYEELDRQRILEENVLKNVNEKVRKEVSEEVRLESKKIIVINMLKEELDYELISKLCNLSIDEIMIIKESNNL